MKNNKTQKASSLNEVAVEKWKKRFILHKGYSEEGAEWLAGRLAGLLDHMQYGYALIAFYKKNTDFQLVRATLIPYETFFRMPYDLYRTENTIAYWDVEQQAWRNFQPENLLEWRPIN